MQGNIINQLHELKPSSNKSLKSSIIHGFSGHIRSLSGEPVQLVRKKMLASSNWVTIPKHGVDSLMRLESRQAVRKVMSLAAGVDTNFTYSLNTALLGGKSYPILNLFLGTIAGVASGGAGLIFSVATTAIDMGKTSQRVLARSGDEIWQVEEIGKIYQDGETKAFHINSYFLADPYRGHANGKGWLIHEERSELTLD